MNLQESIRRILREETENTSLQDKLLQVIKSRGVKRASKLVGGVERLFRIIDMKGTQDDMVFIVKAILEHDLNEPMCNFNVSKTLHSIKTFVNVPLPDPNNLDAWVNRSVEIELEGKISHMIYELGNGLVRGNDIKVSAVRC